MKTSVAFFVVFLAWSIATPPPPIRHGGYRPPSEHQRQEQERRLQEQERQRQEQERERQEQERHIQEERHRQEQERHRQEQERQRQEQERQRQERDSQSDYPDHHYEHDDSDSTDDTASGDYTSEEEWFDAWWSQTQSEYDYYDDDYPDLSGQSDNHSTNIPIPIRGPHSRPRQSPDRRLDG